MTANAEALKPQRLKEIKYRYIENDLCAGANGAIKELVAEVERLQNSRPASGVEVDECTIALVLFQHFSSCLAGTNFKDDPKKQKYINAAKEILRYLPTPTSVTSEEVEEATKRESSDE